MKTLDTYKKGASGQIIRINGEGVVRKRIIDMGLIPGTQVTVKKFAPLGDPIEINIRGYELCIRRSDAKQIEVI